MKKHFLPIKIVELQKVYFLKASGNKCIPISMNIQTDK